MLHPEIVLHLTSGRFPDLTDYIVKGLYLLSWMLAASDILLLSTCSTAAQEEHTGALQQYLPLWSSGRPGTTHQGWGISADSGHLVLASESSLWIPPLSVSGADTSNLHGHIYT